MAAPTRSTQAAAADPAGTTEAAAGPAPTFPAPAPGGTAAELSRGECSAADPARTTDAATADPARTTDAAADPARTTDAAADPARTTDAAADPARTTEAAAAGPAPSTDAAAAPSSSQAGADTPRARRGKDRGTKKPHGAAVEKPRGKKPKRTDKACWPGAPGTDPRLCPPNDPRWGGAWDLMSCIPPEVDRARMHPRERELDSIGISLDAAWQHTTGRDDVVIAVLDSGIRWDHRDLARKIYINRGELPLPEGSSVYDKNRDGIFNVDDYDGDARVHDANANGTLDAEDLIAAFSNCRDDDGNGYPDDIAGYDFFSRGGACGFEGGDNDPRDDTNFGHGTGIATTAAAETNNGIDGAGVCPRCRILPVRVGDSFVVDANQFARGVTFAVRAGATLIGSALGSYNNTPAARAAVDLAYAGGVPIIASAADEFSYHHNFPSVYNHALYVNAILFNHGQDYRKATTFWGVSPCTNVGARVWLTVPSGSCSSGATSRLAGVTGLVESIARDAGVQNLQAEEVYQVLRATSDDLDNSAPDWGQMQYPAKAGFDQLTGYGRLNALKAVLGAKAQQLPPVVDLVDPDWFAVISPQRTPTLPIRGSIRIPRAKQASWRLEYALGVEPREEDYHLVAEGTVTAAKGKRAGGGEDPAASAGAAEADARVRGGTGAGTAGEEIPGDNGAKEGLLGTLDFEKLPLPLGRAPKERADHDRYSVTVRLRASDERGLTAEARRSFFVLDDPAWKAHFPVDLGASGEAEPVLADLDGDGKDEIVLATADGSLRIFRWETGALRVQTSSLDALPVIDPFPGSNSPLARAGAFRETVIRGPALGDLDGDGTPEIVVASREGKVYVFGPSGERIAPFPVAVSRELGAHATPARKIESGILSRPVLADLDGKPGLEIVVAGLDGQIYAWKNDGRMLDGFPVKLSPGTKPDRNHHDPIPAPGPSGSEDEEPVDKIISTPAIGDIDGDGRPEIVVGSNSVREELSAAYAIHADGNNHPGGAFVPGWHPFEVPALRPELLPTIGTGVQMDPLLVDADHDGDQEVILYAVTSDALVLVDQARNGKPRVVASYSMEPGKGSGYEGTTFLTGMGSPLLADTDGDGQPELYAPLLPFRMLTLRLKPAVPLELAVVVGGWELHGKDVAAATVGGGPGSSPGQGAVSNAGGPGSSPGQGAPNAGGPGTSPGQTTQPGATPAGKDFSTPTATGSGAAPPPADQPLADGLRAAFPPAGQPPAGGLRAGSARAGQPPDGPRPDGLSKSASASAGPAPSPDRDGQAPPDRTRIPMLANYPRAIEDLMILGKPLAADVDGDGVAEVLAGSGGYLLHAYRKEGGEAEGFPKFTGGWIFSTPAVGDIDGDGRLDLVVVTREGHLFAWDTGGPSPARRGGLAPAVPPPGATRKIDPSGEGPDRGPARRGVRQRLNHL